MRQCQLHKHCGTDNYYYSQTLFSMGMFNWSAGANETVISSRFWIYWATSIPLTIVTGIGLYLHLWGFQKWFKKYGDDGGPPKRLDKYHDTSTTAPPKGFAAV
jgi:hypothetical protein